MSHSKAGRSGPDALKPFCVTFASKNEGSSSKPRRVCSKKCDVVIAININTCLSWALFILSPSIQIQAFTERKSLRLMLMLWFYSKQLHSGFFMRFSLRPATNNNLRVDIRLTISVSDTGPKLVTKMLVWISVTFSVKRGDTDGNVEGRTQVELYQIQTITFRHNAVKWRNGFPSRFHCKVC